MMADAKNPDDQTGGLEWDTDFRAYPGFAGDIVRVLLDVAGVAHLARGCHMADHAPAADLQSVTLPMLFAATHSMQDHFVCIGGAEPYPNLHISDRVGNVIDHAIKQCVEVEGGGDQIRGPLQLHEDLNEFAGGVDARWDGAAGLNGSR